MDSPVGYIYGGRNNIECRLGTGNTRREVLQTLATNGAQPADKNPLSRQPIFDREIHSIVRPWTVYDESCMNSDEKGH